MSFRIVSDIFESNCTRLDERHVPLQRKSFIRIIFSCIFHNCFFTSSSHAGLKRVHLVGYSRRIQRGTKHNGKLWLIVYCDRFHFYFLSPRGFFVTRAVEMIDTTELWHREYENGKLRRYFPKSFFVLTLLLSIYRCSSFFPKFYSYIANGIFMVKILPRIIRRNLFCYKSKLERGAWKYMNCWKCKFKKIIN